MTKTPKRPTAPGGASQKQNVFDVDSDTRNKLKSGELDPNLLQRRTPPTFKREPS